MKFKKTTTTLKTNKQTKQTKCQIKSMYFMYDKFVLTANKIYIFDALIFSPK